MTTPPEGWYADPEAKGIDRYWSGTEWTSRTRLTPSPEATPPPPAPQMEQQPAAFTNPEEASDPPPWAAEVVSREHPNQPSRPWWKKKRFLIPGGLFAFLLVISPFIPDDESVATEDEQLVEETTTEAPTTTESPTTTQAPTTSVEVTTTTEAPSTTTEAPTTTERETFLVTCPDGSETNAFVDAWESDQEAFDTYCPDLSEVNTYEIGCYGQTIDFVDDGSMGETEYCDFLSQLTLQINTRSNSPRAAANADAADGWDEMVDVAKLICDAEAESGIETDEDRVLAISVFWANLGTGKAVFNDDIIELAGFWGAARGVYCRP